MGHLKACAPAQAPQWSLFNWNLGAQQPQYLQAHRGRLQEDHFLSDFMWEVKGEIIKFVGCAWKEKDKGEGPFQRVDQNGFFSGFPAGQYGSFFTFFPPLIFLIPPFLPTAFPCFVLGTFSFSLSLSTSLPFPRICCRKSGWRTLLLQVQVPVWKRIIHWILSCGLLHPWNTRI